MWLSAAPTLPSGQLWAPVCISCISCITCITCITGISCVSCISCITCISCVDYKGCIIMHISMKSEIIRHEEANTNKQDKIIPGTKYIVFIMNEIVQYE